MNCISILRLLLHKQNFETSQYQKKYQLKQSPHNMWHQFEIEYYVYLNLFLDLKSLLVCGT